jgi:hypothetical protein
MRRSRCPLVALSVTASTHTALPELRADRPYHQPSDDSRRCVGFTKPVREFKTDVPNRRVLGRAFADRRYSELPRTITGMVEGYGRPLPRHTPSHITPRPVDGPGIRSTGAHRGGAMARSSSTSYPNAERHSTSIHLGAAVTAIDAGPGGIAARCHDGRHLRCRCRDLTVALPLLPEIMAARSTWGHLLLVIGETCARASN